MNKEDVLKLSREENSIGYDEREVQVIDKASRIGLAIGGVLCIVLVILSEFVFHDGKIAFAGWMMYLAMFGTQHLVLYSKLKKKSDLLFGVIDIIAAIANFILLFK